MTVIKLLPRTAGLELALRLRIAAISLGLADANSAGAPETKK